MFLADVTWSSRTLITDRFYPRFDSLGMLSSLDEEELQMLEISIMDLPPIKQRRIIKKAEQLAESDIAYEEEELVSKEIDGVSAVAISDARPAARVPVADKARDMTVLVPVADDSEDRSDDLHRSMAQLVPNSNASRADSDKQPPSLRVDNFLTNPIPNPQHYAVEPLSDSLGTEVKPPRPKVCSFSNRSIVILKRYKTHLL